MTTAGGSGVEPAQIRLLQIQTQSACNGRCIMCPYCQTRQRLPQGVMEWSLFTKVIDDAATHRSLRSVSLMLQNEPLLDRRLPEAVAYVHALRPNIGVSIATNGELLTRQVFDDLVAAGLTSLIFSVNALRRDTFARVEPGLDFDKVMANLAALRDGPRPTIPVLVKMLAISENEAEMTSSEAAVDFVLPLKSQGIRVSLDPISNRAGSLLRYEELLVRSEGQSSHHKRVCEDLFGHLNVLFNGDVIGCCADWERKSVLGNLATSSVDDIWMGREAQRRRRLVLDAHYASLDPCRTCSQAANILAARAAGTASQTQG